MSNLSDILPVYGVEHNAILSKMGDITIAFKVELPELFTMSNDDYEAFHHSWIKAMKVLPVNAVLYKQDWFTETKYKADFRIDDSSFLARSSERFFNERPYLNHECFIMLTKKPANRKTLSSVFSSLLRKTIVPEEALQPKHYHEFMNHVGQFEKILSDSGFIALKRLKDEELVNLIIQYVNLQNDGVTIRDIEFKYEWKIGEN